MERCRFYAKIGAKGGRLSRAGGFGSLKEGLDGLTGLQRARKYVVITFFLFVHAAALPPSNV